MNIFSGECFGMFDKTLSEIHGEIVNVLSMFNDDVYVYVANTEDPFNISVNQNDVIQFVEDHYLELAAQVKKVFKNTVTLNSLSEDFVRYFNTITRLYAEGISNDEQRTMVIGYVLIFILKNYNNSQIMKRVSAVLKSMCVQPTVGVLVHASSGVLEDSMLQGLDKE